MTEIKHKGSLTFNILQAIELANSLRRELGAHEIDDLPPGKKYNANQCVLARAFNFDCSVASSGKTIGRWAIYFGNGTDEQWDTVKDWAENNGLVVCEDGIARFVELPAEIGTIASWFDWGELPEYDDDLL